MYRMCTSELRRDRGREKSNKNFYEQGDTLKLFATKSRIVFQKWPEITNVSVVALLLFMFDDTGLYFANRNTYTFILVRKCMFVSAWMWGVQVFIWKIGYYWSPWQD